MLIYLLIFIELLLLVSSYYCFQKSFFSPSFVFIGGFLFASTCTIFFQDRWGGILHWNSFSILLIGFIIFFITAFCVHIIYRKAKQNNEIFKSNKNLLNSIEISNLIYISFMIIHILAIFFIIKKVKGTAIMYGTNGSWGKSIEVYRYIVAFTTKEVARIGFIGNWIINITRTLGFFWNFVFIYNYLSEKRKISILALINLILCIICEFLGGARTGIIVIVIACIVDFYIIWSKKYINKKKLPIKYVLNICIVFFIVIISFQFLGSLIGRNVDVTFAEYFAKYVGSPIKNLDIFIQKNNPLPNIWGKETFAYFINWIGGKTQNIELIYNLDLPYINLNGFNMGNVYTTFYMFIYDFGVKGVIGCTAVMAFISQIYYELVIGNKKIRVFNIIIYSMIIPQLLLSFFSNKFYETFATVSFIQRLIILRVMVWMILEHRISLNKGKIKICRISKNI